MYSKSDQQQREQVKHNGMDCTCLVPYVVLSTLLGTFLLLFRMEELFRRTLIDKYGFKTQKLLSANLTYIALFWRLAPMANILVR